MGENPSEEIQVQPEFPLIMFGDGYIALLQGGTCRENSEGIRICELIIKPTQLLRKRYNIKDSDINSNGQVRITVNEDDLIPINLLDNANQKWIYTKTYNHNETELSKLGWKYKKRLIEAQKRVWVLEGELLFMYEQLQLAKTAPAEFINQSVEVFEKIGKNVSEILQKKDKGDYK